MADRVLRDEIWQSERFLDLPTDAARLAFIRFVSEADDFGNFEGGQRRLFRILMSCTQIKTEQGAVETIDAMMACDLIRRYEVESRELFHIPKLRPHRQYMVRKMPASPWDKERKLGKDQRVINRGFAKDQELAGNVVATSQPRSIYIAQGVGVGEIQAENLPPNGGLSSIPEGQNKSKEPVGIWDLGIALLGEQGLKEKSSRAFLSSLLKYWNDETVEEAFRSATGKADIKSYVLAVLKVKPKKGETAKQGVAL